MTPGRRICEEVTNWRMCGRPASWAVGLSDDGLYPACDEHARAWAPECRAPLGEALTPIQVAIRIVLGAYTDQLPFLTAAERDVLRDVIAARLARDYLADLGELARSRRAA